MAGSELNHDWFVSLSTPRLEQTYETYVTYVADRALRGHGTLLGEVLKRMEYELQTRRRLAAAQALPSPGETSDSNKTSRGSGG